MTAVIAAVGVAAAALFWISEPFRFTQAERAFAREACELQYADHLRNAQNPAPEAGPSVRADGSDRGSYVSGCSRTVLRNGSELKRQCSLRPTSTEAQRRDYMQCIGYWAWLGVD